MRRDRFARGSGVFTCVACARRTRETGQSNDRLCLPCYELAGIENAILDGCSEGFEGEAAHYLALLLGKGVAPDRLEAQHQIVVGWLAEQGTPWKGVA